MSDDKNDQVRDLEQRWVEAELLGDVAALERITTEDFTLVGPLGFVLDKEQWLDRYAAGTLVTKSLTWDKTEVRQHGSAQLSSAVIPSKPSTKGVQRMGVFAPPIFLSGATTDGC